MKILIPYDINTTGLRNPFLYQLVRSIEKSDANHQVMYGFGRLSETERQWDVIHIHWPEELIKSLFPATFTGSSLKESYIDQLESMLLKWKRRGARIITTIHNELPHNNRSDAVKNLYRMVYRHTDEFIHMGRESVNTISSLFPDEAADKSSTVIPHGDYTLFPNQTDRAEARKRLEIEPDKPVILSFGAIRSEDELNLGIDAVRYSGIDDALYLIAGKLPYPFKSQWRHYSSRRKLFINRNMVRKEERVILPSEVQWYLNAADLLFIPRIKALNSGNVSLGFTFGKVVSGPDIGVIGETLKATGNPVFDPYDTASVAEAVKIGFELAKTDKGEQNRHYSEMEMNWEEIARKHLLVYAGGGGR